MTTRILLIGGALLVAAACRDARQAPNVVPTVPTDTGVAQLVISDTAAAVGDTVRVTAMLAGVASFTARVRFDSTALRYVGEHALNDGAMRAANGLPGELRVAGAALEGFGSGALFAARFEVRRAGGLESLRLTFDQMGRQQ
jgi:hypothetical protein